MKGKLHLRQGRYILCDFYIFHGQLKYVIP